MDIIDAQGNDIAIDFAKMEGQLIDLTNQI